MNKAQNLSQGLQGLGLWAAQQVGGHLLLCRELAATARWPILKGAVMPACRLQVDMDNHSWQLWSAITEIML